jgi:hypothetical protein
MENVAMSVKVFADAGAAETAARVLNEWKMSDSWGEEGGDIEATSVTWGAEFVSDSADIEDVGRALEKVGVSYWARQEAKGDIEAAVRGFAPDLGVVELGGNQQGEAMVKAGAVLRWIGDIEAVVVAENPERALEMVRENLVAMKRAMGLPLTERFSL